MSEPGVDMNREKLDRALPIIRGLLAGLAVVAIAAVFAIGFLPGMAGVVASQKAPDPIGEWSTAKIMGELGDYDQLFDCAQVGLPPELSGYVWVKTDLAGQPTRFLFICKP